MINEIFFMNGYVIYVWSAFLFTFLSFVILFVIIRTQFVREKNRFLTKFGTLNSERATLARSQVINKEILSNLSNI